LYNESEADNSSKSNTATLTSAHTDNLQIGMPLKRNIFFLGIAELAYLDGTPCRIGIWELAVRGWSWFRMGLVVAEALGRASWLAG
jgi:hypothetical protein